ncbi:hypothetical protein GCM10010913_00440 [Paenibacillus aceti]|uniref:Uncharacterized protein n=1 Tax=Paenibacillus aceti TaxID=1820010 RepID=A0ABQ1VN10_9BACL|nr:hypothetical protein GCM10010913_00440 [Paenibacillus aceti]
MVPCNNGPAARVSERHSEATALLRHLFKFNASLSLLNDPYTYDIYDTSRVNIRKRRFDKYRIVFVI